MSIFYIDSGEGIFELTSTSDIQITQSSRVSRHPIEEGQSVTDHITNNNTSIRFNGVISDIKRLSPSGNNSNQRSVEDFIISLRNLRDSKKRFDVYYDDRQFGVATGCYITNLEFSRDSKTGSGYKVSISFEQARIVQQATVATTLDDQSSPDKTQNATDSSGSNTEVVAEELEPNTLFGDIILSTGSGFIGEEPPTGG